MEREAECTFGQAKRAWGVCGEEERAVCLLAGKFRVGLWYGVTVGTGGMFKLGLSHRFYCESLKSHSHMAVPGHSLRDPAPHPTPHTPHPTGGNWHRTSGVQPGIMNPALKPAHLCFCVIHCCKPSGKRERLSNSTEKHSLCVYFCVLMLA